MTDDLVEGSVEIPCPRCGRALVVATGLTLDARERNIRFAARCACGLEVDETFTGFREKQAVAMAVMKRLTSRAGGKAMGEAYVRKLLRSANDGR